MNKPIPVYLVEDEADLADTIRAYLCVHGFSVTALPDAETFLARWSPAEQVIVVIDVNLPGEDGFSLARRIRAQAPEAGIVMLTARGRAEDRVAGMELGADNYLLKPVVLRELTATLCSLVRRLMPATAEPGWALNKLGRDLRAPSDARIALTAMEFTLLDLLARCPGQTVTAQEILEAMGKPLSEGSRRTLDCVLSRLRRKVAAENGDILPVRSARGVGYVFTGAVDT